MSELVFVGTSDAFGAGGRRQSAILLRAEGGILIDCGATTGSGLSELRIQRDEIDVILVSHFHGDHYAGIPFLLLAALYEDERRHPLTIAGPPGIESRVHALADAMGYAIPERHWSFPIRFEELAPGREQRIGPVRLSAFQTRHQPNTRPHGMVLSVEGHRIAYSGDTGWFAELPRLVGESDLFICECTYSTNEFEFHLDHDTLVQHKHEFHCGRMILTHLGEEMAQRRGQAAFETADDGLVIEL